MSVLWITAIALIACGGTVIYCVRCRGGRRIALLTACVCTAGLAWLAYDSSVSFGFRNMFFWVCCLSSILLAVSLIGILSRKKHDK